LIRAPGIGGRRLIDLLEATGSAAELLQTVRRNPAKLGLKADAARAMAHPDTARLDADLDWLEGRRRYLITWDSERYPALLRRLDSPPAALFIEGDPEALWRPQLAIVGSRNPTAGGLDHARAFSTELCRHGLVITSGLASGIDCAAHDAALACDGRTVAVTGTGLDLTYPRSSAGIAARIPAPWSASFRPAPRCGGRISPPATGSSPA
jgi:DNA processing protein